MNYLEKNLSITLESSMFAPIRNTERFRKYVGKVVGEISRKLYAVVKETASNLNIYTHEVRSDSKAAKIFLKQESNFFGEEVLWKELLIYFMNSKADAGLIGYLKSIEPLDFDEALAPDYLECFQSLGGSGYVLDELEEHYLNLDNQGERLEQMKIIGNPMVCFDTYTDDDDDEDYAAEGANS